MRTGRNGFPDRFYAKDGRVVLMEWKKDGKEPDAQQAKRHRELRSAGVEVHVVHSIEEANKVLDV